MRTPKLLLPVFLWALLLSFPVKAQGIPVYDAAGFAQFLTQLDQMAADYAKQLEQLNEAIKQTNSMTGTRNMGSLANSALESELRRYLPTTWEDTMNMINANNIPSGAVDTQSLYNNLYTRYNPISGSDFIAGDPTSPIAQALDRRTGTTYAAMAASEQSYNIIEGKISTYESLLDELDNTTDLKASIDLQARISAENGLVLNELMRLNAIQIQQRAVLDNEELTGYRRAATANQYDAAKAAEAMKLIK